MVLRYFLLTIGWVKICSAAFLSGRNSGELRHAFALGILARQGSLRLIISALIYPWHIPIKNSSFNVSQWNQLVIYGDFSHTLFCYKQCLICRSIYSKTQTRSAVYVIERTGRYTGIPIKCVSVFRPGRVFALFSRVKRHDWRRQ